MLPYSEAELVEGTTMFMTRKLAHLVIPVLAAMAFQPPVAAESAGARSASKSTYRSATKAPVKSTVKPASRRAATGLRQQSPITISITSSIRRGNLVVSLDGVPVFNEEFQKPFFLISQTTSWDPLQVAPGKHKLTARVVGTKGKTYLSGVYDLDVSRNNTKGLALRIRVKGDGLTVEPTT